MRFGCVDLQQYVEELKSCLQMDAADQPLTPAAVRVVKLANEIVRPPFLINYLSARNVISQGSVYWCVV